KSIRRVYKKALTGLGAPLWLRCGSCLCRWCSRDPSAPPRALLRGPGARGAPGGGLSSSSARPPSALPRPAAAAARRLHGGAVLRSRVSERVPRGPELLPVLGRILGEHVCLPVRGLCPPEPGRVRPLLSGSSAGVHHEQLPTGGGHVLLLPPGPERHLSRGQAAGAAAGPVLHHHEDPAEEDAVRPVCPERSDHSRVPDGGCSQISAPLQQQDVLSGRASASCGGRRTCPGAGPRGVRAPSPAPFLFLHLLLLHPRLARRVFRDGVIPLPHIYGARIKGVEVFCPLDPPPPYEEVEGGGATAQVGVVYLVTVAYEALGFTDCLCSGARLQQRGGLVLCCPACRGAQSGGAPGAAPLSRAPADEALGSPSAGPPDDEAPGSPSAGPQTMRPRAPLSRAPRRRGPGLPLSRAPDDEAPGSPSAGPPDDEAPGSPSAGPPDRPPDPPLPSAPDRPPDAPPAVGSVRRKTRLSRSSSDPLLTEDQAKGRSSVSPAAPHTVDSSTQTSQPVLPTKVTLRRGRATPRPRPSSMVDYQSYRHTQLLVQRILAEPAQGLAPELQELLDSIRTVLRSDQVTMEEAVSSACFMDQVLVDSEQRSSCVQPVPSVSQTFPRPPARSTDPRAPTHRPGPPPARSTTLLHLHSCGDLSSMACPSLDSLRTRTKQRRASRLERHSLSAVSRETSL
uniref:Family with sequence similarity 189 member A2 n=1 Tax=Neogobius melanostomus TaxID=47308 RepID=A0A8C6TJJ4_9GOBI